MNKSSVTIIYCIKCKWLLRAGWMAQELLSTFCEELESVSIKPDNTGGVFEIFVNNKRVYSRAEKGGFPEIKELKQLIRDEVAPEKNLGHIDQ